MIAPCPAAEGHAYSYQWGIRYDGAMTTQISVCRTAFVPIFWILLPSGTNGYVTSWGAKLAGVCPSLARV